MKLLRKISKKWDSSEEGVDPDIVRYIEFQTVLKEPNDDLKMKSLFSKYEEKGTGIIGFEGFTTFQKDMKNYLHQCTEKYDSLIKEQEKHTPNSKEARKSSGMKDILRYHHEIEELLIMSSFTKSNKINLEQFKFTLRKYFPNKYE